jgi:hypothetical protein
MCHGKRAHRREVLRVGAVGASKLFSSEVRARTIARRHGRCAGFELLRRTTPHDDAHLKALERFARPKDVGARHRLS